MMIDVAFYASGTPLGYIPNQVGLGLYFMLVHWVGPESHVHTATIGYGPIVAFL